MFLNFNKIKKNFVKKDDIFFNLIKNINDSELKIALIIDDKQKLIGTATDGDVRRALLKGTLLNGEIKNIINKKPIVAGSEMSQKEYKNIIDYNKIQHLPILKEKRIIGLYTNEEHKKREREKKNKIIIMAGGFGKRLKNLTKANPKALLRFKDKTLIEHIMENANKFGFNDFTISVFYKKNKIIKYLKNSFFKNYKINFITEEKPMGTIGAVGFLKNIYNDIIVLNCDVITNVNLKDLLNFHKRSRGLLTMSVKNFRYQNPYGVINSLNNKFISFVEKPAVDFTINAGIYVFSKDVIEIIKYKKIKFIEELIEFFKKKKLQINLFPIFEDWIDLGSDIKRLKKF